MKGLSLDRLKSFLDVADAGNIHKAAEDDLNKQSQYSRQIKDLETYFQVALKKPKGRSIELNEEGKQLAALARQCFAGFHDFHLEHNNKKITFVIAAHLVEMNRIFIPGLPKLTDKLAKANVGFELRNLNTQDIIEQIQGYSAHFGILREDAVPSKLNSFSMGEYGYSLFVPSDKIGAAKRPSWKSITEKIPLATMVSKGRFNQEIEAAATEAGVNLNVQLPCDSFETAATALGTGEYAVILPDIHASNLKDGTVKKISVPFLRNLRRRLALVWKPGLFDLRPKSKEVFGALKAVLKLKKT
ncbi:LysR family transcriptional regulator [bacterium]|nr:LysR family transcriptional regulator [bacterium]